ncbi:uncharacterized protein LOC131949401 [Physella acuta]|uniref:uncharacterized protein LOC131949401 n=1 Tax=Physella acuta TaxID=109671 RepID=UPI0027DAEFC7|nr:uncharacterized protein LOC131949401 [Physella acuta]
MAAGDLFNIGLNKMLLTAHLASVVLLVASDVMKTNIYLPTQPPLEQVNKTCLGDDLDQEKLFIHPVPERYSGKTIMYYTQEFINVTCTKMALRNDLQWTWRKLCPRSNKSLPWHYPNHVTRRSYKVSDRRHNCSAVYMHRTTLLLLFTNGIDGCTLVCSLADPVDMVVSSMNVTLRKTEDTSLRLAMALGQAECLDHMKLVTVVSVVMGFLVQLIYFTWYFLQRYLGANQADKKVVSADKMPASVVQQHYSTMGAL